MIQTDHDAMTGLPNLIALVSDCRELPVGEGAMVIIDVEAFAEVNETHGRDIGDRVVITLGDCLHQVCTERGAHATRAYRLGGDEFMLLLEGADWASARQAGKRAGELLRVELLTRGLPAVNLRQAEALYPQNGGSLGAMLAQMYHSLTTRDDGAATHPPRWAEELSDWFIRRLLATVQELGETRRQALTDPVSGLPNHRAGEVALDSALRLHERQGKPFTLLFIDGDDLRAYNDAMGYEGGNRMIYRLGQLLSSNLRGADFVCRWLLGDEFVAVLPGADREAARQVAERLCQAVATASATWPLPVTVSVGLAAFPVDGLGATELLHAAVEANQRAKQAGKNRVA